MPLVTVTRRLTFNAAHRVFNPSFTDAENLAIYGKCSNPNWHGHNYVLEVSVRGEVDPATGYVIDLAKLKRLVERILLADVDHRNLNVDVAFMQGVVPTTENIVLAFWRILAPVVAPSALARLRLWETENNYVEYSGE